MSSWLERAEASLQNHADALKIIDGLAHLVIDTLTKPDSDARAALQAVEHGLAALIKGYDGTITRAEVQKTITALQDRRAALNAEMQAKLDAKFDRGGDS